MYIISSQRNLSSAEELDALEQQYGVRLPQAYRQFLQEYGQGTYCDWFHVELPDPERLKEFAEYGLWEHAEDSPITAMQLAECVVIASTVDGDMLALHPHLEVGIWLPRHSEQMITVQWTESSWEASMQQQYAYVYGHEYEVEQPTYFEPWNGRQQHELSMLHTDQAMGTDEDLDTLEAKQKYLQTVAIRLAEQYEPSLRLENQYTGKLFYKEINGYVRFNYAYGNEVGLFYEPSEDLKQRLVEDLRQYLRSSGIYENKL